MIISPLFNKLKSKAMLPFLALLVAHLIWGLNFVVVKVTLQEIPPMSLSFLRFFLASLFLIPFLLTEKTRIKVKSRADLPRIILVGTLMTTIHIGLFFEGILRTTVIQASALTITIPIISVLISWIFLKEKVYIVNIFGIILGLLGALVLIGVPLQFLGQSLEPETLIGNGLILLTCISWVIGAILSKPLLKKYSTLHLTTFIFVTGAISFAIPAMSDYLYNPGWVEKVSVLGILGVFYITLLSSISAYFLFEYGVGKVGVITADVFQYIQPVIAVLLSIFVLGEGLRGAYLYGIALIILGVYLGTYLKDAFHKHHRAHKH